MNETIGNRIVRFRKAKGLTQEALAEQMGVSAQAVSKWENDISCPDINILPKLCRVLGVTSDALLMGSENEVVLLPESQRKPLDELTLRIKAQSADGDKVSVNLPMPLVQMGLELGVNFIPDMDGGDALKKVDLHKIMDLVERGVIGKLIEAQSADGDTVEVVVE